MTVTDMTVARSCQSLSCFDRSRRAYTRRVGRWEPGARGRMIRAAMELYAGAGYEQTTVADIAARAGVTERTYFRHFPDKREVLFGGSTELQQRVVDAIAAAPAGAAPLEAVAAAFEHASALLADRRDHARRRAAVIAANTSLRERDLLKLASLTGAAAEALRARGVPDPAAALAAETGVAVFRIAFDSWIAGSADDLARSVRTTLGELTALVAGG